MQIQVNDFFNIRRSLDEPVQSAIVRDLSVTLDDGKLTGCIVLLEIGNDDPDWFDISEVLRWIV